MNKLTICFMLNAMFIWNALAQQAADDSNLAPLPEQTAFNDKTAPYAQSNLASRLYQDFIHQLYRFDKDNLKRVDNLFQQAGNGQTFSGNSNNKPSTVISEKKQPTFEDYIRTQEPPTSSIFGISQDSTKRYKRSAQGAIFRPLFGTETST
ncbi:uncharacterized protein LOC116347017 isoform X2 [Contarinia nasturtii]|uniref:uncharacterized protein LOC116347017 isoform X2 n=1 Tax=Contarinia nasturtii TaxID=265458 RepID=UPI0012D41198|nr:uncharacterized protein LOC116347017 isoform X2 [Contarinia nasturtii]